MFFSKKKIIFFFLIVYLLGVFKSFVYAEDSSIQECRDNNKSVQECPEFLKSKLNLLQGQSKSLSSQIAIMDSQINLTQARIEANKRDILDITLDIDTTTKKIVALEESLNTITGVLLNRIVATYEAGRVHPLEILLSSRDASNLLTRLNYLRIAQAHDKKLIYDVQQAKNDYSNQKEIFEVKKKKIETLKKQLEAYTAQLNQEKNSKQDLLNQTKGSEATYQSLLAQAQAQLTAFSNFTQSQGGASILSNQTVCDDWGCYYNQRDSQWGKTALNNTQYTLAGEGCLVTSMAMVYTHYGHKNVNPLTVNSISDNFASYYPAYLKYTITADGATSNRVSATIDSELSSGHPVVVGVSYDGGPIPDHFVVLISGSNGNYKMHDPFTPNGNNIDFSSKYSVGGIVQIHKVSF